MTEPNTRLSRQKVLALLLGGLISLSSCGPAPTAARQPASKPVAAVSAPATAPVAADTEVDLIPTVELVPTEYRHKLVQQLSLAEENRQSWLKAIIAAPVEHREAMAYLLNNMSESDLKKLKGDYLLKNVELAYQARGQSEWARAVPLEIFFADVLPYANVDETREDWRQEYYDRFYPLVKDAKSATEVVQILNKKIFPMLNVKYHATKRQKPNQSPSESTRIGYASCTGLSIILSDACRAVGVPARLAGTPLWSDNSGNHTWTEVWDKQWYFVGAAEPGKLNQTWFAGNAAKADANRPECRIYAASFAQTPTVFPLVWDLAQTDVHAVDVTGYYTGRQTLTVNIPAGASVQIKQKDAVLAAGSDAANAFSLAGGQEYTVVLTRDAKTDSRSVMLPKDKGATVDFAVAAPQ